MEQLFAAALADCRLAEIKQLLLDPPLDERGCVNPEHLHAFFTGPGLAAVRETHDSFEDPCGFDPIQVPIDINGKDEHGDTVLHVADHGGWSDFIPVLLEYGADKDITDRRGRTAADLYEELNCDEETVALIRGVQPCALSVKVVS
jgi:ankyrin repeat protein